MSQCAGEGLHALLQARKNNCKKKCDLDKQMVMFGRTQLDSEMSWDQVSSGGVT